MSFWDDGAGYDIRDPKHPGYGDRMWSAADDARKADRENPEPPIHLIHHDESPAEDET